MKQIKTLKAIKPEESQEYNQLKDFFQKRWEIMKLKMN